MNFKKTLFHGFGKVITLCKSEVGFFAQWAH